MSAATDQQVTRGVHPLVQAAESALMRSLVEPDRALRVAGAIREAARRDGCPEAETVALRSMALAARELGDLESAEHHLLEAIALPDAPPGRVAQARLSLVTVRTERGHPLQALRVAALAWAHLSPIDRAKLDTQRAVALARLGRHQEAISSCDRAIRALAEAPGTMDDRRFLAGGLLNRGLIHSYRGDWDAALRDLTDCLRIAKEAGLRHLARLSAANLPFLSVRRGDLAAAFKHYHEAEDALFGFPERLATMRADFADALLAVNQPGEARAMLDLAVPDLEASGALVALAEARLKLAQVELLTGDPHRALQVAEQAAAELAAQQRTTWLPLAREVVLRSRLALGPVTRELLTELAECAGELEECDAHVAVAAALRLVAAETALSLDDRRTALDQLTHLTRAAEQPAGRPDERVGERAPDSEAARAGRPVRAALIPGTVRQHALALKSALLDDPAGAFTAVRDGLAEVSGRVEGFDDPSLRAHAARSGERLAAFGLELAVREGSASTVFEWAERWRAVASPAHASALPDPERVRAELGGSALVEYVADRGALLAVMITERHLLLRRVGDLQEISEAILRLRYALRRPTQRHDTDAAAVALEELVLRPLLADLDDRPLVIVPVAGLHKLPWGALPGLRERPVSVAAGTAAWLRARANADAAARRPGSPPVVVAAAGPELEHARTEVAHVVRCHPGGRLTEGRVGPVREALSTADVVHLAAHGTFHARTPLGSGITLEDGALMAYDLLELPRTPGLVVLSACNSGMSRTPMEGAPLGLPGTFLAKGSSCVIAGMVPIGDEEARAVMSTFHELVAAGQAPDAALACAAAKTGEVGFTCFGAGDFPLY
ncbi:CHAT domain-containing tetratricopeptide repeat protein [Nonomuraea sp. N2-4H]|uniref:CHAT domain-containing protein n=1 Tax=Nonomuraea sp. N2-4H TaxID=3128898 RepID=UPI00324A010D